MPVCRGFAAHRHTAFIRNAADEAIAHVAIGGSARKAHRLGFQHGHRPALIVEQDPGASAEETVRAASQLASSEAAECDVLERT